MSDGALGRMYDAGEIIFRQGDPGDCMYVVQEGEVEVFVHRDGRDVRIAVRGETEFFGEMALFEKEVRSASVRALGPSRVLKIDRKNFLKRIHADPALAYRIVQTMSHRLRELSEEVAELKGNAT